LGTRTGPCPLSAVAYSPAPCLASFEGGLLLLHQCRQGQGCVNTVAGEPPLPRSGTLMPARPELLDVLAGSVKKPLGRSSSARSAVALIW